MALEENLFLFKCQDEKDKARVLSSAPWTFNKQLILFQEFKGELRPEDYVFKRAPFWVRVYDLPLGLRNQTTGTRIGQRMGNLLSVDNSLEKSGWASFLRLRVEMDVTKPLQRGVKLLQGPERKEIWGRLSYERLSSFYYVCGLLRHTKKECATPTSNELEGTTRH
ncbi:hypothetical protein PTKIN_Ptkin12aG0056100 [Pterospermum kingtungense]